MRGACLHCLCAQVQVKAYLPAHALLGCVVARPTGRALCGLVAAGARRCNAACANANVTYS